MSPEGARSSRSGGLATRALAVAQEAAREAGRLQLRLLGGLSADDVRSKSARRDLVTRADVESERAIVRHLRRAFPDHAIEAEEEVRDGPDDGRPRWFLDPLDGTINFVHQLPAFAVSLGLWFDGKPQAALVHAPRLAETFSAEAGGGAFLNGAPIRVSRTAELADAILATGFAYRREHLSNDNLGNFAALFHEVRGLRRMGSAAIDLAYTAAGRFDGYWELELSPHDVGAGGLLVREAGGVVTDLLGGEDWLRGGHILAAGPLLHGELRGRLKR